MRKPHQAKTRAAKKKRGHYAGLTSGEGTARAKKGWQTRRSHGKGRRLHANEPFDEDKIYKKPDVEGTSDPHDMGLSIGRAARKTGGFGKGKQVASVDQLKAEAEKYFELEILGDKATRRLIQQDINKLPKNQQARFAEFVKRNHEFHDAQMAASHANELKSRGGTLNEEERLAVLTAQETGKVRVGEVEPGLVVRNLSSKLVSRNVTRQRTAHTPLEAQKRARQVLSEKLDSFPEAKTGEHLSKHFEDDVKLLSGMIAMSHYGRTEADRQVAAHKAQRLSDRLAQKVTDVHDERAALSKREKSRLKPEAIRSLDGSYKEHESAAKAAGRMGASSQKIVDKSAKDPRLMSKGSVEDYFKSQEGNGLRANIKAEREMTRRKKQALSEGTFTLFRGTTGGKTQDPFKEASSGIIPNRTWLYTLRHKPDDINVLTSPAEHRKTHYYSESEIPLNHETYQKKVNPWDTRESGPGSSVFHVGKRDAAGRLHDGDWDQIVDSIGPTHPDAPRRFNSRFHTELGERGLNQYGADKLDRNVAKHIIVESDSVHAPVTRTLQGASHEKYNEYLVRDDLGVKRPGWKAGAENAEGEWGSPADVFASRARMTDDTTAQGGRGGRERSVSKEDYDLTDTGVPKRIVRSNKDIKITYVPPGSADYGMKSGERDYLMARTPTLGRKGRKPFLGEHAVFKSINEDSDNFASTALRYGVFEPERVSRRLKREEDVQSVLKTMDASGIGTTSPSNQISPRVWHKLQTDPVFQKQVAVAGKERGDKEWETEGHMKTLLRAGGAAALYKASDSARHTAAQGVNTRGQRALNWVSGNPNFSSEHRINLNVYGRVADENIKHTLRTQRNLVEVAVDSGLHPTHSISGEVRPGGLRPRKLYGRKSYINPTKLYQRELEMQGHELGMIVDTKKSVIEGSMKDGIRGRAARATQRSTLAWAEKATVDSTNKSLFKDLEDRGQKVLQANSSHIETIDPITKEKFQVKITPQLRATSYRSVIRARELAAAHESLGAVSSHTMANPKMFPRASRWKTGELTPTETHLLIGGAVVGTALGAGYLYNRHVNKKRVEAGKEPIAFYNRVLPPTFKSPVPTPSWQTTQRITIPKNELNDTLQISGNKIIAGGRVHFDRKTHSLRPMDRDPRYTSGLPVGIPRISLRTKGDTESFASALNVNVDRSARKGRSWTKEGAEASVRGKKLPFYFQFGDKAITKKSSTNPHRLTDSEREAIVATFAGKSEEHAIKQFYSSGKRDKIIDLFDDPSYVRNAKRKQVGHNIDPGKVIKARGHTGTVNMIDKETGRKFKVYSTGVTEETQAATTLRALDSRLKTQNMSQIERDSLIEQRGKLVEKVGVPDRIRVGDMIGGPDEMVERSYGAPDVRYQAYKPHTPSARERGGFSNSDRVISGYYNHEWLNVEPPDRAGFQKKVASDAIEKRLQRSGMSSDQAESESSDIHKVFEKGISDTRSKWKKERSTSRSPDSMSVPKKPNIATRVGPRKKPTPTSYTPKKTPKWRY